ncbi:PREDICTED: uncharacterized protein LOC109181273 [Ipomoea nil]|uniref:uncharacterized protein LOC109181273 n=1 Tax=Ipomoea nil TaxID=35883 RepID=UPI0009010D99|nr:PREDICTED: uncharacterized protein LOC109181273 [Ipomoea nil]
MGSDQNLVNHLLSKLSSTFKIRDLGEPGFFLAIETVKCDDGILLSQQRYMNDILKRVGMTECKPLSTPIPVSKSVHSVQIYMMILRISHWEQLKRVLRYVKGTLSFGLRIRKSVSKDLHAFSDSDWASCPEDFLHTESYKEKEWEEKTQKMQKLLIPYFIHNYCT